VRPAAHATIFTTAVCVCLYHFYNSGVCVCTIFTTAITKLRAGLKVSII